MRGDSKRARTTAVSYFGMGLLVFASMVLMVACKSTMEVQSTGEDFSRYFLMHVGDTLIYARASKFWALDTAETRICFDTTLIGGLSYYRYKVIPLGDTSVHEIDTFFYRRTSTGDVYQYSDDSLHFAIDFHTLAGSVLSSLGAHGKVLNMYFSSTAPVGTFDSCISISFFYTPEGRSQSIYAPDIGEIYSSDPYEEENLIYAHVGSLILAP